MLRTSVLLATLLTGQTLWAQDAADGISLRLGVGPIVKPGYFGSDEMVLGPTGSFQIEQLQFGPISIGDGEQYGLGFAGSLRFIGSRAAADFPELDGLTDIDTAVELGGGVRFTAPSFALFADLRNGVVGHDALVAEMGGDLIYRPSDQITLSAGPRVFWGSDDYAQTYFGVTAAESLASGYDAFDAGGGFLSAGVEAEATYQFNDDWGLTGTLRYDQLREDAADSPITQSTDQLSASLVVTRKVTFGF